LGVEAANVGSRSAKFEATVDLFVGLSFPGNSLASMMSNVIETLSKTKTRGH
jgi:hypothetical protein